MSASLQDPPTGQKSRVRGIIFMVILVSLGIHVAAGIIAGVVIVARYLTEPPAVFKAVKDIRIPARDREHRMNMASYEGAAAKPAFTDKMASARPTEFALPDIPQMPMDAVTQFDPSGLVADQVATIGSEAGIGSGYGSGAGGGGSGKGGSAMDFLGLPGTGQRIVLIFDVSASVTNALEKAGVPMSVIKDKIRDLLKSLSINTTFGIAQFSRQYAFFNPQLVPASDPNRAAAQAWLDTWFSTGGVLKSNTPNLVPDRVGFTGVLTEAFKLKPDLVYIVGDGSFQRGGGGGEQISFEEINSTLKELQKSLPEPATINFIGVGMRDTNRKEMRRIISTQGGIGRFKELETKE